MFELELSWVGEFTDGVHKRVPEDVSLNVKYYVIFLSPLVLTLESLLRCYRTQRSSPSLPLKRTATLTRLSHKFQQNSCPRDIQSDEGMSPISFKSLTCPNCTKYKMVE